MTPAAETIAADEGEAIRSAAAWFARKCSGSFGNDEHAAWQVWLNASELHRSAWQQVENVRTSLGGLPGHLAGPALRGVSARKRQTLRTLAVIATAAPLAWLGYRAAAAQGFTADLRTAVGERRTLELADGSSLSLDTDSAVDVAFDQERRLLRLRRGRIMVTTADDPQARLNTSGRPFLVATAHGTCEALGTRFTVRTDAVGSQVAVLDDIVRVTPNAHPDRPLMLNAGQQLRFDATGGGAIEPAAVATGTWAGGSLVALDMPLAELLAELARYRHGILRCAPSVAGLRISGAFPLDDTERSLKLLTETFPLQTVSRTRYWVEVHPA
ncbi:FecR domain-containing protein [Thauera linaloolentis]|uniref:Fec operon regulator FecR n=1 Tax=Thauera linaloolentis (strain DSM 12138 / JCM 21573 / CCUG 41526 / CIP 105981 / IAM 15112 / NBRC 102519 / 47Lol) TaxID=1123367 RepID=N6Z7D7_THAL4|nr:FecR domain-containing protein [Thauera linaloolentis]ENO90467.1 fec operon regulator FecR [Thauera linaloolentis 47Lol = DSM 12138]MCM8566328.1 FecR domain-containing protein [Thauera linaloolentis]